MTTNMDGQNFTGIKSVMLTDAVVNPFGNLVETRTSEREFVLLM